MLLHLGNDVMVSVKNIIFILDMNTCQKSKINQIFLSNAVTTTGKIIKIEENSKSLVIVKDKEKTNLYYSPISSVTLLKRSKRFLSDYTYA